MTSQSFVFVLSLLLVVWFPALTSAIVDARASELVPQSPQSSLAPESRLMQTQVRDFPVDLIDLWIASGANGICVDPRCEACRYGNPYGNPFCEGGFEAYKLIRPEFNDPLKSSSYYYHCADPHLFLIHPLISSVQIINIPRPVNVPIKLFQTSKPTYSLETHGYEWVYVNADHRDAREYEDLIHQLRDMVLDNIEVDRQTDFIKTRLLPALKAIAVPAIGCDSVRLVDDLPYVDKKGISNAGANIGGYALSQGKGKDLLIEVSAESSIQELADSKNQKEEKVGAKFRFPGPDDDDHQKKIIGDKEQQLRDLLDRNKDVLKNIEDRGGDQGDRPGRGLEKKDNEEYTQYDSESPDDLAIELPQEVHDYKVQSDGWIDVMGGCQADEKSYPVIHVDPVHATALKTIRDTARGKEVWFDKQRRQDSNIQYKEMYNIWIWISDNYCKQPLAFDIRENGSGGKHINTPAVDGDRTRGVVFSHMKPGDFAVYRTHDVAHTNLEISDTSGCASLSARDSCRIAIELRVFGYGNKYQCRGALP